MRLIDVGAHIGAAFVFVLVVLCGVAIAAVMVWAGCAVADASRRVWRAARR